MYIVLYIYIHLYLHIYIYIYIFIYVFVCVIPFVPQVAADGFAEALEEASPFFSKEQQDAMLPAAAGAHHMGMSWEYAVSEEQN